MIIRLLFRVPKDDQPLDALCVGTVLLCEQPRITFLNELTAVKGSNTVCEWKIIIRTYCIVRYCFSGLSYLVQYQRKN